MAAVRAALPVTGARARSHEDARRLDREAADALLSVAEGKRRAALADPFRDLSDENLATARREDWRRTEGPTHGR